MNYQSMQKNLQLVLDTCKQKQLHLQHKNIINEQENGVMILTDTSPSSENLFKVEFSNNKFDEIFGTSVTEACLNKENNPLQQPIFLKLPDSDYDAN